MRTSPDFPHPPIRVTAVYALVASAWIVLSDSIASGTGPTSGDWRLNVAKGLLFVAVTSAALYLLLRREERRRAAMVRSRELSENRWRTALESAGHGMWDWDLVSGKVFFSAQWKRMLGCEDSAIGHGFEEWESRLHPEDREAARTILQRYLDGFVVDYESVHRLRAQDGTYRWIRASGRVVERDEDGEPVRMVGTHTDLTAGQQASEQIADELAFNRAIFESSPVGIISYRADGAALSANAAAARIVGATETGLVTQNFRQIESWRTSGLRDMAEQALATGLTVQREVEITTSFGRTLWMAAHFVPFRYRGEQRLLLLMRDVSERRSAVARLKLLQAALEAAPTGVAITDATGAVEWINEAFTRITGYNAAEVVGKNQRMLKSGRHGPEFYRELWTTILAGRVWSGEIQNARKDGGIYTEHMTIAPVRDESGAIRHFVAIKQDASERKALEQQLARTQRLESIGMLASGLAHDLNNIFTPILLSLELLKVKYPTADGRKTLELIEGAGQRGAGIVKQVLAFARGLEGERVEIQARHLLKELAQMLQETLPRNIAVQLDAPAGLPPLVGDPTQLHQVLLNLAINARDAMPGGGALTLRGRATGVDEQWVARHPALRAGPHVALSVTDTGTGIPPEVLEHIFEPFFTTKPRGQGTGLGLSTVYGIVRSHQGAVDVATVPGRGTTFTVLLPALARPSRGDSRDSNSPLATEYNGCGHRLLVVDDEESIRLVALHALQRHGFVVETAVDGLDALDVFRNAAGGFSAVITDLMMPRMNGVELTREVRRLDRQLPIIAVSGQAGGVEGGPTAAVEAGISLLLQKPFTEAELLAALGRVLEGRAEKKV